MKKLFSVSHSDSIFDIAALLLRVGISIFMIHHGYHKMTYFTEMQEKFINFLGLSGSISLCLTIFAEFFCSIAILLGLMTRLATIPLIITMFVAVMVAHKGDVFGDGETATIYMLIYIFILLVGPGRYSADATISWIADRFAGKAAPDDCGKF